MTVKGKRSKRTQKRKVKKTKTGRFLGVGDVAGVSATTWRCTKGSRVILCSKVKKSAGLKRMRESTP